MAAYILPPVNDRGQLELLHFPTRMQAFVFRNWELMPADRLAAVLGTDEATVNALAADMGLPPQGDTACWLQRGYITVIKANWHLLPYDQLLQLLGWSEDKLAYVLREDDFLGEKLGNGKPFCPPIAYAPLTPAQQAETAAMAATVRELWSPAERAAFDFFAPPAAVSERPAEGVRLTDDWSIVDRTGFPRAPLFAARFAQELQKWGVTPTGNRYEISLETLPECAIPEAHRVVVTDRRITVQATDEAGLLRGLHWLTDRMDAQSAPVLPPADITRRPRFGTRMIYSYHGLYGNVFDEAPEVSFSDEMLAQYARLGVNGIWAQGVLYKLTEFPFDPAISEGWQQRQENLRALVKKAAEYGLKVYLYLNEPRAMPLAFFEKFPHLKGHVAGDFAAMCTSVPEVQQYLSSAVTALCKAVPGLGGFFTITMSENLTNCWSRTGGGEPNCPRCAARRPSDVVAEVNTLIYRAATAVDPTIRMIAWTWGWKGAPTFSEEECLRHMPPEIVVMNVSEEAMPYTIAGVDGQVIDYTMSMPGPGDRAKAIWQLAKQTGHPTAAKVQINDTWECSTVPYVPVFGLVEEHIGRLATLGVDHLMLSWTLGGAPSPNIKMAARYFFDEQTADDPLTTLYGEHADTVRRATACFDEAFREFPFCIETLYTGPHFSGPANLLYAVPSGQTATMTGFPYDDLRTWCGPYPPTVLESQFGKLADKWKQGLELLAAMPQSELTDIATACYNIFRSSYNQIRFVRLREQQDTDALLAVLDEEEQLAISHYRLTLRQPMLGYEAANHYVYTPQACLEKALNCRRLKHEFTQ